MKAPNRASAATRSAPRLCLAGPRLAGGLARRARRGAAALLLLAGLPAAVTGCTALGALAYKMSPEVTVPAEYQPAKEPMVVIVQRSQNPADAAMDAERIGRYVTDDLKQHGVGPMVDPAALLAFQPKRAGGGSVWAAAARRTAPAAQPMTVPDLGRAVGARQVLYVDLTTFTVESATGSEMVKGQVEARVRVIDADTGQTLWPTDTTQGHAVGATTPYSPGGPAVTEAAVRDRMSQAVAGRIARLFYSWKSDQVDAGSPVE